MSNASPSSDKAAIGIDRLTRLAKELRTANLSGLRDRWDPRIEAFQKRINQTLADVLGDGSPEYKAHRCGPLDALVEPTFGDRYSDDELKAGIRAGLDKAIASIESAKKVLAERLTAKAPAAPGPAPKPAPAAGNGKAATGGKATSAPAGSTRAATPAPTVAPTPEPTAAPTPAPTPVPTPAPSAAPPPAATPAPTPAPTAAAPSPAPTAAPAPTAPTAAPTPAPTPAPSPMATPAPTAAPTPAPTAAPVHSPAPAASATSTPSPGPAPAAPPREVPMSQDTPGRIAIVNRLDGAAAAAAAAFVTQLGMEPAPLSDAPASGPLGAIDRLEGVRGAGYALVLVPAEDLAAGPSGVKPQTLVEIGFLFGVLGRRRVCFLVPGKPATAPALEGLVPVHSLDDAELWRLLVAREMRKAGLDVDMNRVA